MQLTELQSVQENEVRNGDRRVNVYSELCAQPTPAKYVKLLRKKISQIVLILFTEIKLHKKILS